MGEVWWVGGTVMKCGASVPSSNKCWMRPEEKDMDPLPCPINHVHPYSTASSTFTASEARLRILHHRTDCMRIYSEHGCAAAPLQATTTSHQRVYGYIYVDILGWTHIDKALLDLLFTEVGDDRESAGYIHL